MPPVKKKKRRRGYHRGTYVSTKTGQSYSYRSGWELKYMQYLDTLDEVKWWGYEILSIEYLSNKKTGKVRKYYPDFCVNYADGTKKVVEIKQKRKLGQATVKKKTMAGIEWCKSHDAIYEILTEVELKGIGVL